MTTIAPDWLTVPATRKTLEALAPASPLFVGGCVRDALMGRETRDIDIAVKTAKIQAIDRPMTAPKAQKTICAVEADLLLIIAPKPKTKIRGANMMSHLIGELYIATIISPGISVTV